MPAVSLRARAVLRAQEAAASGDHALNDLVRAATSALSVEFGFLSLVRDDHEVFLSVAGPEGGRLPPTLPVGQSVCQFVVATGRPLLVTDLGVHPVLSRLAEVRLLGVRSYAGAPVTGEDAVLGSLCVADGAPRHWTPQEESVLVGLAAAASSELRLLGALVALEQAQERGDAHAREQGALHRVATAVARGDAPGVVLQQVAEELATLLAAEGAAVVRFARDGHDEVQAGCGAVPALDDAAPCRALLAAVREGGSPRVAAACRVAPVLVDGQTWGALVVVGGREESAAPLEQLAAFVSMVVVNTERHRRLHEAARTDPLTGSANRRAFDERLTLELARAARTGHPLTLALLDVDRFKAVNDAHGHDVGDAVLRELCARVQAELREPDLLARLGGDEWALLLPETPADAARGVLDRVLHQVRAAPLGGLPVTVTVGGRTAPPGCTPDGLYRMADAALYEAKEAGRDRVHVPDPEDST